MRNICVVGAGYVGLVTGTCFSDLGNRVTVLDVSEARIKGLREGVLPIYEPGLEEVVKRNVAADRLRFTTSYPEALAGAEFVFIAVGTPEGVDGEADLQYVRSAAESVADHMDHPVVIVNKSTVPVGTGDWVSDIVKARQAKPIPFSVVSCPEFLREGSAIQDFLNPARIVLGSLDKDAAHKVADLHLSLRAPIVVTDLRTAEMIKYASNAFLATKISFINEIANICEALGADVKEVAAGMGYDTRIGRAFLDAGLGYGGSCFPKDVKALAHMARTKARHPQLLETVMQINQYQRQAVVAKVCEALGGEDLSGRVIGVWGLAFKPNTDDLRDAPAIEIIQELEKRGAALRACDPVAARGVARILPKLDLRADAYQVAEGADAVVLCTEWNEYKQIDLARVRQAMRTPVLVDGRNVYDPARMRDLGFVYRAMGRG
ncbi:MAG: UDP-glucose/GDP-mannose dehydrogenase family protein [Bryobacterales bacterium]|nr:UDP-glucose/GDP-mannose dehydrogenase family protein [Bryobacterales bacterium]